MIRLERFSRLFFYKHVVKLGHRQPDEKHFIRFKICRVEEVFFLEAKRTADGSVVD